MRNERGFAGLILLGLLSFGGLLFGGPWYVVVGDSNTFDNSEDITVTTTETITETTTNTINWLTGEDRK